MKRIFLLSLLACLPCMAAAQSFVNPDTIQQHGDIYIQNTDVYYKPFLPPDSTCTRQQLSNQSVALSDSDGLNNIWPHYQPMVRGVGELNDTPLYLWHPYSDSLHPIGQFTTWQRLFQALDKPDGTHSDIIAGSNVTSDTAATHGYGPDTIRKNEDVDFRATGTIKLENGFHVMPGAFFHAYQEPKWDTAVFSDEFNDSATFYSQWHVSNTYGGNYYGPGAECTYDSNTYLDTDYQAHDDHALDLIMREDTVDTCHCHIYGNAPFPNDCENWSGTDSTKFIFSAGVIRSCPFPYQQQTTTPFHSAYPHQPFGKYEVREKIPHIMHHTNTWGLAFDYGFEYDIDETYLSGDMSTMVPNWGHQLEHGPYIGHFSRLGSTEIFFSSAPGWAPYNTPTWIVINNVPYGVGYVSGHGFDTVQATDGTFGDRWPSSLADSTGPITFYYAHGGNQTADTLPWKVTQDSFRHWRIFSATYHHSSGVLLHFSKTFQPNSVTLTTSLPPHDTIKTFACQWDSSLNWPTDKGLLYLDDTGLATTYLDSGDEAYGFTINEGGYPEPYYPFNGNDTTQSSYQYHTFAMEWLPHEVRFLVDSVVVRRWPDRLVPPGDPHYDWVSTMPRGLAWILPAQTDFDYSSGDPFGADPSLNSWGGPTSITYVERKYFEHAAQNPHWPGFETVDRKQVAHYLIDYVKVWDVPKNDYIPNLPH